MPAVPVDVADPTDDRLLAYTALTDAQLRARVEAPDGDREDDHGSFIVEGHLALESAVRSPYPLRSVLVAHGQLARVEELLATVAARIPVYVVSQAVLEATVGFRLHRGVVACASRLPPSNPAELLVGARRVLVLEGVNDHENLGGLFRNAAAFGVDAVLLDPTCADPLYRRTVRVSLGHVLGVPFSRLAPWPDALAALTAQHGLVTVALTPDPAAPSIDVVAAELTAALADTRGGNPVARGVALLLGAEGPGLTDAVRAQSVRQARIPMAPGVDSLNVATAGAVALFALTAC